MQRRKQRSDFDNSSENLESYLKDLIKASGPITVSEYMRLALSHEDYGYYRRNNPLGKEGDFITSPEISQIFGELLGAWIISNWHSLGMQQDPIIVELGPGRGTLMKDMLRLIKKIPALYSIAKVHMVEINGDLKEEQRKSLADEEIEITWHESLETVPRQSMFLVANEFFDALPINQFVKTENGWNERLVGLDDEDNLTFMDGSSTNLDLLPKGEDIEVGGMYETSPDSIAIIQDIANRVRDDGGTALVIDYGYFHDGFKDTFQAVKKHEYWPVLKTPGEADLTSHVNFPLLKKKAEEAGAKAYIDVTQGELLEALGLSVRSEMLAKNADEKTKENITLSSRRLSHEDEMGTLFKCMAIAGSNSPIPLGFS